MTYMIIRMVTIAGTCTNNCMANVTNDEIINGNYSKYGEVGLHFYTFTIL